MSITGLPGQGPVRVGIPVADLGAGIFCAMGILVALLEREVSGEGQWVQSSLLGGANFAAGLPGGALADRQTVPGQAGNDHPTSIPTGVFPTARWPHQYCRIRQAYLRAVLSNARPAASPAGPALCRRCGPLQQPRRAQSGDFRVTKQRSSAELIDMLNKAGVPCGPINRDGPGVRGSASSASRHGGTGRAQVVGQH